MKTFWQWLKQQARRNDPIGDLARDARQDPTRKRSLYQWWERHLQSSGASPKALRALGTAWSEYQKQTSLDKLLIENGVVTIKAREDVDIVAGVQQLVRLVRTGAIVKGVRLRLEGHAYDPYS
ncbi:MAG: YozE family protein [Candidatus Sulfotelmatobacter sp.]